MLPKEGTDPNAHNVPCFDRHTLPHTPCQLPCFVTDPVPLSGCARLLPAWKATCVCRKGA